MAEIIGSDNNWVESFKDKGLLLCWCAVSEGAPLLFKVSVDGFSGSAVDVLDHVIDRLTEFRSRIEEENHETQR